MRKSAALDPLLSRPVQQVLTALLVEREEPWYLTGLAKRLGRSPSTLQRPLTSLVEAGILRRWSDGNRIYFARNPLCPFLPELKALLIKTAGLADVLRSVLQKFKDRIDVALIFGSFARGDHRPESDVDLLVIGELSLAELSPALRRAELQLGREVNASLFRREEVLQKLASKNHFLRSVLAGAKIFLQGTPDDLEELTGPSPNRAAHYQPPRAR